MIESKIPTAWIGMACGRFVSVRLHEFPPPYREAVENALEAGGLTWPYGPHSCGTVPD